LGGFFSFNNFRGD